MRKWIWYCAVVGVLMTGSFLSLSYYACCCPDSVVGRSMQLLAEASLVMQPLKGLKALATRVNQVDAWAQEAAPPIEESIPDDPQPIVPESKEEKVLPVPKNEELSERKEIEPEAAPIVIGEDEPIPPPEEVVPSIAAAKQATPTVVSAPIEVVGMQRQEIAPKDCLLIMPYCRDEEDETIPPTMPHADAGEDTEHTVFKAWMELFEESKKDRPAKSPAVEQLPPPVEEESQAEPKCQEDSHLHEHYPGCPRTTCPYRSKGKEESSEEPWHPSTKPQHNKDAEECPRTKGVDTMEYRKSDAGLNEYGPGPLH